MNKLLVLIVILAALGYYVFDEPEGEFTADGDQAAVLFVINGCGPCDDAVSYLRKAGLDIEVLRPNDNDADLKRYKRYRTNQYPLLVIGKEKTVGFSGRDYDEAFGRSFGLSALPRRMQRVYKEHFSFDEPKVVMYGTAWCGFCAKARKQFDKYGIDYIEWNVEEDERANRRFRALGGTGYPLIYVGFERMHQVDKSEIRKAMKRSAEPI